MKIFFQRLFLLYICSNLIQGQEWIQTFEGDGLSATKLFEINFSNDNGYIASGGDGGGGNAVKVSSDGSFVWGAYLSGEGYVKYIEQFENGKYVALNAGTATIISQSGELENSYDIGWYGWSFDGKIIDDEAFVGVWSDLTTQSHFKEVSISGEIQWEKILDDFYRAVDRMASGDYFLSGYKPDSSVFMKTDSNGNTIWEKKYDLSEHTEYIFDGIFTSDSFFVAVGADYVDGTNETGADLVVIKLDENGDSLWTKRFGGDYHEYSETIIETFNGNYLISGYTKSYGEGDADAWLLLIDSNGDSLWSNTYGTVGVDKAYSVVQFLDGSFVFCGQWNSMPLIAKTNYAEIVDYSGPVWYVATTGSDETGNGSEINPFATIQHGIEASSDGDTVLVAAGTYVENINFNGKNIAVIGEDRETTIIDGNQNGSVVTIDNGETLSAMLYGFSITNGNSYSGGGIYINNSSPTLKDLKIINNSSDRGGGIYCNNTNTNISNIIIENNSSTVGGGGINIFGDSPIISNIIVKDNSSRFGGGINIADFSTPTLYNILIYNNEADDFGGGILVDGHAEPILINLTITRNQADRGDGIYNVWDARPKILLNSIVTGNYGHEVYWHQVLGDISNPPTMFISNSNIYGSVITNNCGIMEYLTPNINANPLFIDPDNGEYNLSDYSICIGAGADSIQSEGIWYVASNTDVENNPRPNPAGSNPDIGAHENLYEEPQLETINKPTIPEIFALHQNHPNPFNPTTTLRYDLPEDAMANITIYDMMGRVVSNLVSSQQNAGYKSIQWNATNNIGQPVSAGLYLYTIQAGKFRQTKKMVLLK